MEETPQRLAPPDWLPPAEKLTWAREHGQAPTTRRARPWATYTPTPAEQAELDALKAAQGPHAYTTRWRAMRDAAQAKAEQQG